VGRAAVDDDSVARQDERGGGARKALLRRGVQGRAVMQRAVNGRSRQRAAMHPRQQPLGREFAQVAANRVFRRAEFACEIAGDQPSFGAQAVEEEGFALFCQHA